MAKSVHMVSEILAASGGLIKIEDLVDTLTTKTVRLNLAKCV